MDPTGHSAPAPADPHGPGYETREADPRKILLYAAALTVFTVASVVLLRGIYGLFLDLKEKPEVLRLPVSLGVQLRQLRSREETTLGSYGWADRRTGVVKIPIERAMDLVAEKGVPTGKGARTDVQINSSAGKAP